MKTYAKDYLQEIAFPLSGIGCGGLSISGIGALVDWELTGKANKRSVNEYSHFAVKAEREGKVLDARVLQGDLTGCMIGFQEASHHHSWGYGQGINRTTLAGLAHFSDVTFSGEFPLAHLSYGCDTMPADIKLTAYNPFIPGDEDNSSLPAAFFEWEITNTAEAATDYTLAFSVGNPFCILDECVNTYGKEGNISSITLSSKKFTPDQPEYGELTVSSDCDDISYQEYWYRSGWFDDLTTFWREFSAYGPLKNRHYDDCEPNGKLNIGDMATLAVKVSLAPGESRKVRFLLTWYFPNFVKYWDGNKPTWKHEYCRRFASTAEITRYGYQNWEALYRDSKRFAEALGGSTLPEACVEAASTNLSVLKSPTCLRLENGEFWAFEGTGAKGGSCEGTCDHVWNYQYALAFLFPRLARQILEIDYAYNTSEDGAMAFRTMLPLGTARWGFRPCVDGQMGSILRFYREWKFSGDDEWLRRYWPTVKKTLEFAWNPENHDLWDPDKTGVIRGRQHHTLDMELFGANSWLNGYYLAALKACAEMAEYLGEGAEAELYRSMFAKGSEATEAELFNGAYYVQNIDFSDKTVLDRFAEFDPRIYGPYWNSEANEIKYQFGEGSEIDQMIGQWHATMLGLGDIFDPAHRKIAVKSLYDNNFRSMREVFNPCRIFAVNDERGVLICNWPEGAYKPAIPIPYTEECMTGFEYAAAGLMLQEGMIEEGVAIVEAIRERYDGKKRNPYAEIECGSSYARSMASFALPAIFSGFTFDMTQKRIGFAPIAGERPFKCFWSLQDAWGTVEITDTETIFSVLYGALPLEVFGLPEVRAVSRVTVDGEEVAFSVEGNRVCLPKGTVIRENLTVCG